MSMCSKCGVIVENLNLDDYHSPTKSEARNIVKSAIDGLRSDVVAALRWGAKAGDGERPAVVLNHAAHYLTKKPEPEVELPSRGEWAYLAADKNTKRNFVDLARAILDGKVRVERVR